MKLIRPLLPFSLLIIALSSCKTSEENYKKAYSKAIEKGVSTAVDKEVYEQIKQEDGPVTTNYDGVTLPVKQLFLSGVSIQDIEPSDIDKFCIVTARFRQTFNARSMANRLREAGFTNAFVAKDRNDAYFVVAATTGSSIEAEQMLQKVEAAKCGANKPFPYIIVKP